MSMDIGRMYLGCFLYIVGTLFVVVGFFARRASVAMVGYLMWFAGLMAIFYGAIPDTP